MTEKLSVPISLDERTIDNFRARNPLTRDLVPDSELDAAANALRTTRGHAEQIHALSETLMKDPTRTPAAAALQLRQTSLKLAEKAAASLDNARAKVTAAITRLETETAAPALPVDVHNTMLQGEIRQALSRMKPDDRNAALTAALEKGDDSIIGAVLHAPAILSGLTDTTHAMFQHRFRTARFPIELDRISRLGKALDAVERGGRNFVSFVDEASATPQARMAEAMSKKTAEMLETIKKDDAA